MSVPRVAFFTDSYHEVNGVALTSREFARFAREREYPFLSVHSGPRTCYWQEGNFETLELAHSPFLLRLERDLSFDLRFMRQRNEILRRLRIFRPDLIHVTGPSHVGMLGAILAYRMNVPLAASWHTNLHEFASRRLEKHLGWVSLQSRRVLVDAAERHTLELALRFYRLGKLLFAPNLELVNMLGARTGRPTYLMQRGVDTDLFSPRHRTRKDARFVIGFVGRLSPEKNVRVLRDIERILCASGVRDYQFMIVGDGSERPWLAANMERASLPGILSGHALAEAYANMDAFVFPSETDTFGNVVLEAMASGVPCVVTGSGGPKYLVQPGRNGYVGAGLDELAHALMDLRSHPALRAELGNAARAAAMRRSWASVFQRVYSAYGDSLIPYNKEAQFDAEAQEEGVVSGGSFTLVLSFAKFLRRERRRTPCKAR